MRQKYEIQHGKTGGGGLGWKWKDVEHAKPSGLSGEGPGLDERVTVSPHAANSH